METPVCVLYIFSMLNHLAFRMRSNSASSIRVGPLFHPLSRDIWPGKEEKGTMVVLAQVVLLPIVLDSFIIISVLLAIIGTLYLAYDLLGRQHGPLQWLTLVITCGLVSTFVLGLVGRSSAFSSTIILILALPSKLW